MTSADYAFCPRCGGGFRCGVNQPDPCACGRYALTPATLQALRERYDRCLCMACLAVIEAEQDAPHAPQVKKPAPS